MTPQTKESIAVPDELPFLAALSHFDARWTDLSAKEMLERYESGWRYRGVVADPTEEELAFIRSLVKRFGSHLNV